MHFILHNGPNAKSAQQLAVLVAQGFEWSLLFWTYSVTSVVVFMTSAWSPIAEYSLALTRYSFTARGSLKILFSINIQLRYNCHETNWYILLLSHAPCTASNATWCKYTLTEIHGWKFLPAPGFEPTTFWHWAYQPSLWFFMHLSEIDHFSSNWWPLASGGPRSGRQQPHLARARLNPERVRSVRVSAHGLANKLPLRSTDVQALGKSWQSSR